MRYGTGRSLPDHRTKRCMSAVDLDHTDPRTPETVPVSEVARDVGVLTAGDQVGGYTVVRRVGAGGMGEVYLGYDPRLRRSVAIKVVRRGGEHDRLLYEAQAMAQLSHPNVIVVHEAGLVDDR